MKPFRFRLQTLLDVAEQRERGVKHELVRAQNREREIQLHLEATVRNWLDWQERLRQTQRGALDVTRVKAHLEIVRTLQKRMRHYRAELESAKRLSTEVRNRLTEAARERRSLERLREKRLTEHAAASGAEEVRLADDLVSARTAGARGVNGRGDSITGVLP